LDRLPQRSDGVRILAGLDKIHGEAQKLVRRPDCEGSVRSPPVERPLGPSRRCHLPR